MDIFCWNISAKLKRSSFKKWFRLNKPIFGSLIETHVKPDKAQAIVNRSFPGWTFVNNYEFSSLGKIWVIWHQSVFVRVISKLLQMITCTVKLTEASTEIVVSFVYGYNFEDKRKVLWKAIVSDSSIFGLANLSWTVLGGFQSDSPWA